LGLALIFTSFSDSHNYRRGLMLTLWPLRMKWFAQPSKHCRAGARYKRTKWRWGLFRGAHETGEPIWLKLNNTGAHI
jgi:hypothetical protein